MLHRRRRPAAQPFTKHRAVRGLRFESLEQRDMLAADFGDAIGYASASHEAVGPQLGQLRDANAQLLNALANGDASDEDGVVFGLLRAGQSATVTIYVANAPAGAKLDAGIDFNRDGDFTDADEQIIDNVAVIAGDNVIAFTVPATVVGGANFARFRLSTAGNLGPSGAALDGEVEDYLIPIADAGSGVFGGQRPIGFDNVGQIAVTDLDSDGDTDILNTNQRWRRNAHGSFGPEFWTGLTGASSSMFAPADVDGDGDMDYFGNYGGIEWYQNNGVETFTRRMIHDDASSIGIAAVDLDGDGDVDLVAAGGQSSVNWYANDGNGVFTFATIPTQSAAIRFVTVHDVDGDGDLDILAAGPGTNAVQWLENDGQQHFAARVIVPSAPNLSDVAAGDFDADGDLDVIASTAAGVVFYANDGFETFSATNLDATNWTASAIDVADFDADGDLDVAASGTNRVAWYENDGTATFARRIVTAAAGTYLGVTAADVNGDGRLDLVTTGTGTTPLAWYEQLTNFQYDYGDAPRPYRVYAQDQGPRHIAVGPQLGATRDAEPDGAHAPSGAGAEDDGIVFGAITLSESTATVTVNVQNAPAGAKLDAWIDFNGDGSWGVYGEQIANSVAVVAGDNTLMFAIPSWAVAGATYARFRLSTAGGLGPLGTALDGEVEDHPLTIVNRAPATGTFGQPQTVIPSASWSVGGEFMVTADVDGDGDTDVVVKAGSGFIWAENLGPAGFANHQVAARVGGEDIAAGDLDNDGDVDFVGLGGTGQNMLVWAENDGQQNFTVHEVPLNAGMFVSLAIADMDADGDMDIVGGGLGAGVHVLVNNGRQQFSAQLIGLLTTQSFGGQVNTSAVPVDMDGDGDLDVVAGGRGEGSANRADVAWFQNNGGMNFTMRPIERSAYLPFTNSVAEGVAAGDVDGDVDVVSASNIDWNTNYERATLVWHERTGDYTFVDHVIQMNRRYRWSTLADFDVDGDLDVVASGYGEGMTNVTPLDYFENLGGGRFAYRVLSTNLGAGWSNAAADMDGDGDLDVVGLGVTANGNVSWFENFNVVDPDYGDAPAPYASARSNGGPVHNGAGPRLGATRTSEADGAPTPNADGDAGDDGVLFSALRVGQASGALTVNVRNAPAGAKLDAWIDFNGDGSWDGPGEQILGSYAVVEGDNALTFNLPANLVAGTTFARVRLSTAGGLRTGGSALDGEVEDYAVVIAPPASATGEYHIAAYVGPAHQTIQLADVDGDGDVDYVVAAPRITWYENLGDGAFLTHTRNISNPTGALNVLPVDLDGDGDVDFAVLYSNGIGWFENDGAQKFAYRAPTTTNYSCTGVFELADVDGDGDLDALAARSNGSTQGLVLLLNDGQQRFTAPALLTTITVAASAVRAADVDGDGDVDFAVTFESSSSSGGVGWYENAGGVFTFHDVTLNTPNEPRRAGRDVVPIDFDFDGDVDLVASTYSGFLLGLEIFRNDGNQNFHREPLALLASASDGFQSQSRGGRLQVADLDADGDYDAVIGGNRNVRLYQNHGAAGFTQSVLAEFVSPTGAAVVVSDLDGDRRLEILATQGSSGSVVRLDDRPFGDYNRNGTVDQADRDLYEATLGQPAVPPGAGADGDRNGVVDEADLAIWEANQGAGMAPPVRAADFNQDEKIDGADFLIWQRTFGATSTIPGGHYVDADFSKTVDAGDLAVWKRQIGGGVAPPPNALATPASSATASTSAPATVMTVTAPTLESATTSWPPAATESSPSPSQHFAIPANAVLTPPVTKHANKKPDVHRLTRSSATHRDAAFASLAAPTALPLRHQRPAVERLTPAAASDEVNGETPVALSHELVPRSFGR
jgi:hypothetical protein